MELLDWLPALFDEKNEHGELRYSDAEMQDFLAAMLLTFGYDPADLTPQCEHLIAGLARRAGVDPAAPREESQQKLAAYFEANPLPPKLVTDFRAKLREAYVRGSSGHLQKSFAKYITDGERKLFEERAPPKPGAVRGGPLGFFLAKKKLDGDT